MARSGPPTGSALTAAGIRRGDRVASLDMNNLFTLEMTSAAALLGAAHTIVNFRLFGEQLAYVLADCAPRIVVVGAEFVGNLAEVRDRVPSIDREEPYWAGRDSRIS